MNKLIYIFAFFVILLSGCSNHFESTEESNKSISNKTKFAVCTLDYVNLIQNNSSTTSEMKVYETQIGQEYFIGGFVINKNHATSPQNILLLFINNDSTRKSYTFESNDKEKEVGTDRPDVASAHNNSAYAKSGYKIKTIFSKIETGSYYVYILDNSSKEICETYKTINVNN